MVRDAKREILDEVARKGIGEFEVYMNSSRSLSIESKNGKVDSLEVSEVIGASIRVFSEGRQGYSYCTEISPDAIRRMVDTAATGAKLTTPDAFRSAAAPGGVVPDIRVFDPSMKNVPEEEKIERARGLERAALGFDKRIKRVRKAAYSESSYEVSIVNSRGIDVSHQGTYCTASVAALAEEGSESEIGYDYDFSRFYSGLDYEAVGRRAAEYALRLLGGKSIKTGKFPVVMENSVAADFLGVLASSFIADSVQKGKSLLAGKMGMAVAAPIIDILDDGLLPGGISTSAVDGEGLPRQKTTLVKGGVLSSYLYDSYSAAKAGLRSTGNAVRPGIKAPPSTGLSNLYISRGEMARDALFQKAGEGLFITEVMGMHTSDPISGDFSVGAAGIRIEKGLLTYPVKGIAIAGNIIDILKGVSAVGDDLRFFGKVGSPSLLISELTVSGE